MASVPMTSRKIDGETMETETDFIFLGSKITVDSDCSYEIKRCLFLEWKAMTNLETILKSRDITLLTNACWQTIVKAMVFAVVTYRCKSWTIKCWTIKLSTEALTLLNCGAGEDAWESLEQQIDQTSQSKENQPLIFIERTDAEAEVTILWPPDTKSWLIRKDHDAGKDWMQEKKGMTEDEMVGWHHWLDGHEFEQASGGGEGQGSLACYSP